MTVIDAATRVIMTSRRRDLSLEAIEIGLLAAWANTEQRSSWLVNPGSRHRHKPCYPEL